jgi:hypothetical protein
VREPPTIDVDVESEALNVRARRKSSSAIATEGHIKPGPPFDYRITDEFETRITMDGQIRAV